MYEPSLDEMTVGQWARHRRLALGLTQSEVAERTGIAQSNLAAIESGRRGVGEHTTQRLREALAARPGDLLRRNRDRVLEAARRHRIGDVRVFGSVVRGEDAPTGSDVDLLVSLPEGDLLSSYLGFSDDVARILTVPVDVVPDSSRGDSSVLVSARSEAKPL